MNTEHDQRLDEVVTAYLKAKEAGQTPDRDELLARHPELAADLAAFFAAESLVNRVAAPLRATETPTIGLANGATGPGTRVGYFGDYHLLEEIGRGGMGVVYKARQETLNRTVALKMILSGQLATDADVRRFRAEAEAAAKLDHPGIVTVFEVGQHEGQHYFSMAFVEGESLAHRLAQGLPAPREAAELTRRVAEAVAYAHVEGVIHRDLKPANILIDKNGQPRLTDFGLAKRVEGGSTLTATGQIVGTPSYMPPEQASGRGESVGPLSDVYSLGAVLYCLLTGRPPFQADNPLDTLMQVLQREPVAPRQLNAAIPRDLETICLKCLEKVPRKRYSSAQEFAADLDRFLNGEPIQARPVGAIEKSWRWCRRNPAVAGMAAALLLVLVSGSIISSVLAIRAKNEANVSAGLTEQAKALAAEKTVLADKAAESEHLTRRYLYSAHMNLAHEAWKNGNVLRMVELLDQHRPGADQDDLRSFEWAYLWQQANRQRKTITLTANEPVGTIKISPDGRWIGLGVRLGGFQSSRGDDSTFDEIRFWDVEAGAVRQTFSTKKNPEDKFPDEQFQELVFSPDGKLFAVVVFDHLMVWHGKKGDGWGAREKSAPRVVVRETETLKVRATIPIANFELCDRLAISPDNRLVAAGFTSKLENGTKFRHQAMVWKVPAGENEPVGAAVMVRERDTDSHSMGMTKFAFSADSKALYWNRWADVQVTISSVAGDEKDRTWNFERPTEAVRVSSDGRYLGVGLAAQGVQLLDPKTGKELHTFAAPVPASLASIYMMQFAFSLDSRLVAISRGLALDVWDIESKKQVGEIRGHEDLIRAVGFGTDSKTVITVAQNRNPGRVEARVWDATMRPGPEEFAWATHAPRPVHPIQNREIAQIPTAMTLAPDGKTLAIVWRWHWSNVEPSATVIVSDIATGLPGKDLARLKFEWGAQLKVGEFSPSTVSLSPDGRWLALGGEEIYEPEHKKFLGREKHVQLWRLTRAVDKTKATLERSFFAPQQDTNRVPIAIFSPDGTKLVFPTRDTSLPQSAGLNEATHGDRLHVYDLAAGKETIIPANRDAWFAHEAGMNGPWKGYSNWRHHPSCNGITWTSDSRRIFSVHKRYVAPWETFIVAWDAATGEALSVLESPHSLSPQLFPQHAMALSKDDKVLATTQDDNTIFIWDVSAPELSRVTEELKLRAQDEKRKGDKPPAGPRLTLRGHAGQITAIAFHPDGKTLVSSSNDGTIKIWDIASGELRLNLEAHAATMLAFTPDGNALMSSDARGDVKLWRTGTGSR